MRRTSRLFFTLYEEVAETCRHTLHISEMARYLIIIPFLTLHKGWEKLVETLVILFLAVAVFCIHRAIRSERKILTSGSLVRRGLPEKNDRN